MSEMTLDTCREIVEGVWAGEANEINRLRLIAADTAFKVVKMLGDCKGRIFTTGCGTSGAAAKKVAHTLSCVERPACFCTPSDAVHGAMGCMQKGDIMIAFSKGGNTQEIAAMLPACESKGVAVIGVTENPDSILAKHSAIHIPISIEKEPDPFNMLATASTMSAIAYFDAVCIALMKYTNYSKEQFLVIHPGGAVGERLSKNS